MIETRSPREAALAARGLVKRFGDVLAVDGLDLEIRRGECFGLLGPNGAGKTTTIEMLEGLTRPDAGEISVLGAKWDGDERALRERLGVSLQETQLADKLTVRETLVLFRSFFRRGHDPDELISRLFLSEKAGAMVGKLSGGQRQRLAVACALVGDPEFLFLDEPTTGLDPQSRLQLWDEIQGFRAAGGTILLTTHYMDEAERLCDRIAIVDHGKVIALGTPAELIATLHAPQIVEIGTEPELPVETLRALPGVHEVHRRGSLWALGVVSLAETTPALFSAIEAAGARVVSVSTHRATLEDLFVARTGRELRDG
ncbi:MAG: ATP-binding cassette domain-containing protein [Thermoanaerobaculia bacterium]